MAHNTIFGNLIAIMTFEAVFHTASDVMTIEVFPGGNTGMTSAAFCLSMCFVGKAERFFIALALAFGMTGLLEVAQAAIGLFPSFEMTFETTFFTRPAESVVNLRLLRKNITGTSIYSRSSPQWLPTRRQTGHAL